MDNDDAAAGPEGPIAARMRRKLVDGLSPSLLVIEDDSDSHRGHGGWREGGETHFNMRIVAAAFAGLSRVERQRRVYALLAEELKGPVHALSLQCDTPDDA